MIADLVGFHAGQSGGFLGNGIMGAHGDINWVTMWPLMSAIDSYVLHFLQIDIQKLPTSPISSKTAQYISKQTAEFAKIEPNFPEFNETVISGCAHDWQGMINRLMQYYNAAISPAVYDPQIKYLSGQPNYEPSLQSNAKCVTGISF